MVKVFEENWIEKLKQRYEKPGVSAPPVFRVATSDNWSSVRDEIENWYSHLSEPSQEKLLVNLRNPDSFIQTYNELAVAGYLLQFGYQLEYESKLNGLTPDWIVRNKDETKFIVEVFSRVVSDKVKAQQTQISELWKRLKPIPIGVGLFIRYENLSDIPKLDSSLTKRIASKVRFWLNNESPKPKTEKTFHGVSFEIMGYDSNRSHVSLAGPVGKAFPVHSEPISEEIEEKIKKYKDLSDNLNLPLVVAVVPSFETGIDVDNLEEILFGNEAFAVAGADSGYFIREDNGLFTKRSILSVVIGLWRNSICNYQSAIFHNPNAQYPLPEKMLKI